jgi:hypothetical protein
MDTKAVPPGRVSLLRSALPLCLHARLVGSRVKLHPHPQPRLRARRTDEVDDGLVAHERLTFPVQTDERRGGGVLVGSASFVWSVVVDQVEVWNAHVWNLSRGVGDPVGPDPGNP